MLILLLYFKPFIVMYTHNNDALNLLCTTYQVSILPPSISNARFFCFNFYYVGMAIRTNDSELEEHEKPLTKRQSYQNNPQITEKFLPLYHKLCLV